MVRQLNLRLFQPVLELEYLLTVFLALAEVLLQQLLGLFPVLVICQQWMLYASTLLPPRKRVAAACEGLHRYTPAALLVRMLVLIPCV